MIGVLAIIIGPRGSGRLRHHRVRGSLPVGSHRRRGRHCTTPQAGPGAGRVARLAIKSRAAANPVTANELFLPGRSAVGRMAERVPGSVAPCCCAVEEHGLADRGGCGRRTRYRPAGAHRRPRRHRRLPTTRWPFPPRPPRAFPSTSAPNSSFPSATPSTPKVRAPDPSWLSSSRAPEPTSPSSPCSPRWPRGRVVGAFFAYVFVVAMVAGLLTDLIL